MAQLDAQLESTIHELHRGGLSSRQIAARLTASGRKVSKSSVAECLRRAPRQPIEVAAAPEVEPPTTDAARSTGELPGDADGSALDALEAKATALWREATQRGDLGAALRATKILVDIEARRARIAEHGDDVIVMRRDAVELDAAKCVAKLHELLDRL